jgi:hypothetical protein
MKGKVNCTCGWSWNKSDSSKKDMYICHECGRDNSNNMKNGGWLDNYGEEENANDSSVSLPEGYVGEGIFNGPIFENPAVKGQFQNGGKAPLYVESKNDPRYKAYQDSLSLYNHTLSRFEEPWSSDKKFKKTVNANKNSKEYKEALKNYYDNDIKKSNIKPTSIIFSDRKKDTYIPIFKKPQQQVIVQRPQEQLIQTLQPIGIQNDFNLEAPLPEIRQQVRQPKYYDIQENINQPFGGHQTNYQVSDLSNITSPDDLGPGNTRKIIPHYAMGGSVYPVNYVPLAQEGKELTFLQPTSDKLPEGYRIPYSDPSSERAGTIGGENGEPAYLVPNFKYGHPIYDPVDEFRKTGEHLGGPFKTWQEADKWESETRHPAVEKGENIMFPQEQFQTGGSLPGSVGFTYARTKGIPSNGPYAKKTLPSAQNGKEMKYYQQGLDWQPKSISQNGSWLNKYEQAQDGKKQFKLKDERLQAIKPSESTFVKKPNFEAEQAKVQRTYVDQVGKQMAEEKRRKKLTKDQREREDYNAMNQQTGSIQIPIEESTWDKSKAIVSNPLTAFGYAARNESLPARFQFGERNTLDNAIDWVNPLQGAVALSEIPGELGRGEFLNAGLSALDAVDLGVYAKGAMKASKPLLQKAGQQLQNIPTSIAPELRQGLRTAGPSFGSSSNNVTNISKNIEDLNYAKDWAKQYGYELPENLERIAQSDELTNRAVRGMMNRHNTFVRGVSTNWDELATRNPEILRHLEGKGFDLSTKEGTKAAAEYMATHVPIQTGYGRASLNKDVFKRGQDAIYTSNSIPTAEGYTYGQGYITKVKKPTDFSSSNRQDWITQNNPKYNENYLSDTFYSNAAIERNKNILKNIEEGKQFDDGFIQMKKEGDKYFWRNKSSYGNTDYWDELSEQSYNSTIDKTKDQASKILEEVEKQKILKTEQKTLNNATLQNDLLPIFNRFPESKIKFKDFVENNNLNDEILNSVKGDEWFRKFASENNYLSNDNPYAHYLHIGTPGEKLLEPIKSWEITPDIWKNKSRAHTNTYSKKLSAMKQGGIIKDDRGQWGEHKGEPTRINQSKPGSYIDMGPDPLTGEPLTEPLLGISDKGEKKIMYPGEKHKYKKGTKYVDEFPIAKNGLRQEQKGLVNLDNLLNFTNYNTKQPGGWLDTL